MEALKDLFNLEHWWKLLALVGATIAIAGIGRSLPGAFAGLGLLLFGSGMWANHRLEGQKETVEGLQGFRVRDVHVLKPNALGVSLCVIGALLFSFGLYKLASGS